LALSLLCEGKEAVVKYRTVAALMFAVTLVGLAATTSAARGVVEIRLHGRYYVEPATVLITVAVEPGARNRLLRIEADSFEMYRASDVALRGADEKRLHTVQFKNLPAGYYTLRAHVLSTEDVLGMASQELVVTGSGMR
jgi:uncharacterized protein (DUF58 family)